MSPDDDAPPAAARLRRAARGVRRAVLRRRRAVAVLLAAVSVLAGLRATAAPPPATVPVPVVARALPAGAVVTTADLRLAAYAPGTVPDDVVDDPVGRVLATAVARGEALTGPRLLDAGLAGRRGAGDVRVLPVRFPDAGSAALLAVGDVVDLVAVDPQSGATAEVASAARVLALPEVAGTAADGAPQGRLTVLGVADDEVAAVADASVRLFLTWSFAR